MAGAESSKTPVFSLRLLVDKKKSKVVLAESGKEFVDVLFSFLTLSMGTIARLLEKYQNQKSQAITIGCFNSLYKSVSDLGKDNFLNESCKDMLLYPLNVKDKECRRLKLNVDDNVLKYYGCQHSVSRTSCRIYSNFSSSRCNCGELMGKELKVLQKNEGSGEIFKSDKTFFTITEKMEVRFTTMSLTVKTLKDLGYTDTDQLQEMLVDVDHGKVLDLLLCLLCSDTPLTDVFLTSQITLTKPSLPLQEEYTGTKKLSSQISISVFTRKVDNKVLYVKSGKDFVDLLFSFLALPLYSAWELFGSNVVLGCVGNLCGSFKSLNSNQGIISSTGCILPLYYTSCLRSLLGVGYATRESEVSVSTKFSYTAFKPIDPRSPMASGFVKEGKTFMVSDGLIITPMILSSTFCQLKKWNVNLEDIEEHVINITKTEAVRLLRASFVTSTALNTVFESLLPKKPKQENL